MSKTGWIWNIRCILPHPNTLYWWHNRFLMADIGTSHHVSIRLYYILVAFYSCFKKFMRYSICFPLFETSVVLSNCWLILIGLSLISWTTCQLVAAHICNLSWDYIERLCIFYCRGVALGWQNDPAELIRSILLVRLICAAPWELYWANEKVVRP